MTKDVLTVAECNVSTIKNLLHRYHLRLIVSPDKVSIPGSYWGDSEAGLIANTVYVRNDTPIHSLLHETCHYICMNSERRENLDTNAEGDYDEENGVCYLQILLANDIFEMGKAKMFQDMDTWGYTFRLGSAEKWFKEDANDALNWLKKYHILDKTGVVNYQLRR